MVGFIALGMFPHDENGGPPGPTQAKSGLESGTHFNFS
jgi:hypothetical protein